MLVLVDRIREGDRGRTTQKKYYDSNLINLNHIKYSNLILMRRRRMKCDKKWSFFFSGVKQTGIKTRTFFFLRYTTLSAEITKKKKDLMVKINFELCPQRNHIYNPIYTLSTTLVEQLAKHGITLLLPNTLLFILAPSQKNNFIGTSSHH